MNKKIQLLVCLSCLLLGCRNETADVQKLTEKFVEYIQVASIQRASLELTPKQYKYSSIANNECEAIISAQSNNGNNVIHVRLRKYNNEWMVYQYAMNEEFNSVEYETPPMPLSLADVNKILATAKN